MGVVGLCRWAKACLYIARSWLEQCVLEHPGQGTIHKLFRILSRPKAQWHCSCAQCHGAFNWKRRKWNVFTMCSKLPSNHSNLGFPKICSTCSDLTETNHSFSVQSVVSHEVNKANSSGIKPINQQRKKEVHIFSWFREQHIKCDQNWKYWSCRYSVKACSKLWQFMF